MARRTPKDEVSDTERAFVLEYLSNGRNGTRAYLATHPNCTSYKAAGVEAFKTLAKPKIVSFLQQEQQARWLRLRIDGDTALALIAGAATADLVDAYEVAEDGTERLKPFTQWPERLRLCVKKIKANGDIELLDPLRARELVATADGKLRTRLDVAHTFDHAGFLEGLTPTTGGKP